jgi:hypothetical protein
MPASERRPYRCPLLIDALRLLPIQPVKERNALGVARFRALRGGAGNLHGRRLSLKDMDELFVGEQGDRPRVSREGARLLLKLYGAGVLDESPKRHVEGGIELLWAYVDGRASIVSPALLPRRTRSRSTAQRLAPPAAALSKLEAHFSNSTETLRRGPERAYPVILHRLSD